MVRRHLIVDEKLQEICKKIYLKYKVALDLIYENIPDTVTEISDYIKEILFEMEKGKSLTIEKSDKKIIRFATTNMKGLLKTIERNDGMKYGYPFLYEIELKVNNTNGIQAIKLEGRGVISEPDDSNCLRLYDLVKIKFKNFGLETPNAICKKWARTYKKGFCTIEDII